MAEQQKIIVGLSGGVDSSVAALLLNQRYEQVEGLFMKNWVDFADESECTIEEDRKDAMSVAETVGIPFNGKGFSRLIARIYHVMLLYHAFALLVGNHIL